MEKRPFSFPRHMHTPFGACLDLESEEATAINLAINESQVCRDWELARCWKEVVLWRLKNSTDGRDSLKEAIDAEADAAVAAIRWAQAWYVENIEKKDGAT